MQNIFLTTFASIVVYAALPQCNSTQTPVTELVQVPTSELAQTLESDPEAIIRALLDAMQNRDAERI